VELDLAVAAAVSTTVKHLIFAADSGRKSRTGRALNVGAVLIALGLLCYFSLYQLTTISGWRGVFEYRVLFVRGWLITMLLSAAALVVSTLIGLVLALARRGRFLPLHYTSRIFVEIIRGTPLLVQILIFWYAIFPRVGLENRYAAGVLILSLFSGAYISEIIRAGMESVGKSQLDSALAIGLSPTQTYRYVIFPQALRNILPSLAGQFASLIKDSSLLSVMAVNEFTLNAQNVNSAAYSPFESYIPLAIGYLILTLPISLWTQRLEEKHRFET
jgi:polar amino acid transport system permease protein